MCVCVCVCVCARACACVTELFNSHGNGLATKRSTREKSQRSAKRCDKKQASTEGAERASEW